MAEGREPCPRGFIKIPIEITHGTINSNESSTVQVLLSDLGLSNNDFIGGIALSGAYNSEVVPWSYYIEGTYLTSRLRNVGNNTATGIIARYYILHYVE